MLARISDDGEARIVDSFPFADDIRNSGIIGIQSLEISPNDRFLIGHGHFGSHFRLIVWPLNWDENGDFSKAGDAVVDRRDEEAFLSNSSRFWFPGNRSDAAQELDVVYLHKKAIKSSNLIRGGEREIAKIPSSREGSTPVDVSEDGFWVLIGDDQQQVYLWHTPSGTKHRLGVEEFRLDENKRVVRPERDNRPEHSGRVVGVALSKYRPGEGFPAYAASIGLENEIKVWDLFPALQGVDSRYSN